MLSFHVLASVHGSHPQVQRPPRTREGQLTRLGRGVCCAEGGASVGVALMRTLLVTLLVTLLLGSTPGATQAPSHRHLLHTTTQAPTASPSQAPTTPYHHYRHYWCRYEEHPPAWCDLSRYPIYSDHFIAAVNSVR